MKRIVIAFLVFLGLAAQGAEDRIVFRKSLYEVYSSATPGCTGSDKGYDLEIDASLLDLPSIGNWTLIYKFYYDRSDDDLVWDPINSYSVRADITNTLSFSHTLQVKLDANDLIDHSYYSESGSSLTASLLTNKLFCVQYISSLPVDVQKKLFIELELVYDVSPAITNTVDIGVESYDVQNRELRLGWEFVEGADFYELEYLFVSDGYTSINPHDNVNIPFDFKDAVRLALPNNFYRIPLTYGKGSLVYRVRTGVYNGNEMEYGNWSYDPPSSAGVQDARTTDVTTRCWYYVSENNALEVAKNWQVQSSFIENGLRKDVISFHDGSGRSRQAVTSLSSDDVAIVSEGKYDQFGRPVLSILPGVTTKSGLNYYSADNGGAANNIDPNNFFSDQALTGNAIPTLSSTNSLTSKYYSSDNDLSFINKGAVPDAADHVTSQTILLNDGTGRPSKVSQPGSAFSINGNHTSNIYYGKPSRFEIDRLFGNEVGHNQYYSKIYKVDANGQIHVEYRDQADRLIVSALAGNAPSSLLPLTQNGELVTVDILGTVNSIGADGEYIQSQTFLFSEPETQITLVYDLTGASVALCDPVNATYNCSYDVYIEVTGPNGEIINSQTSEDITSATSQTLNVTTEGIGSYTVTRIIKLNESNIQAALYAEENYLLQPAVMTSNACVPYYLDPVQGCDFDGSTCAQSCATTFQYVSNGITYYLDLTGKMYEKLNISGTDYYRDLADPSLQYVVGSVSDPVSQAISDCQTACDDAQSSSGFEDNSCDIFWNRMLADLSPGGQVFENMVRTPGGTAGGDGPFDVIPESDWAGIFSGFGTTAGVTISSWDDASAHWQTSFAEALIQYHPEYCVYLYYCEDNIMTCASPSGGISVTNMKNYINDMYGGDDLTYAHTGNVNHVFTNPFAQSQFNNASNQPHLGNYSTYINEPWNSGLQKDPIYSQCNDANSLAVFAQTQVLNGLQNFMKIKDPGGNHTGGYYSLWYVLDDPDGIASGAHDLNLHSDVTNMFKSLHVGLNGDPAIFSIVNKYQFFRGMYQYLRDKAMYDYLDNNFQCPSTGTYACKYTPAYDYQGGSGTMLYTLWDTDTDYDTETDTPPFPGFYLTYPRNALFDNQQSIVSSGGNLVGTPFDPATANTGDPGPNSKCKCDNFFAAYGGNPTSQLNTIQSDWLSEYGVNLTTTQILIIISGCIDETYTDASLIPSAYSCGANFNAPAEDCHAAQLALNQEAALARYLLALEDYLESKEQEIKATCLADLTSRESLTMTYTLREYQYTLYYYDRAGNLIKTVPPKGVFPLTASDVARVDLHRADNNQPFIRPAHKMITNYRHSSLGQVTKQTTPDGGETTFWYDRDGRVVFSQDAQQVVDNKCSYTLYDVLGRIIENGELTNASALPNPAITVNGHYVETADVYTVVNSSSRADITYTRYDSELVQVNGFGNADRNLQNRVAQTMTYTSMGASPAIGELQDPASTNSNYGSTIPKYYATLTSYSYDELGNVNEIISEINYEEAVDHQFRLQYEYDLLSGNVLQVKFSHIDDQGIEQLDEEFHHRYKYDEDNRLVKVETSYDGVVWQKEAKYFYYPHGALSRVEIGEELQGVDYAYTLLGWLKQINGIGAGAADRDLGKDGGAGYKNAAFPEDAFKSTIGYYDGDYTPISTTGEDGNGGYVLGYVNPNGGSSTFWDDLSYELHNGNIAYLLNSHNDMASSADKDVLKGYRYDQMQRIKEYKHYDNTSATGGYVIPYLDANYSSSYNYDKNGNITNLTRHAPGFQDNATYHYYTTASDDATNRLSYVSNPGNSQVPFQATPDRIEHAATPIYQYDKTGNLVSDRYGSSINSIQWNVQNKVTQMQFPGGKNITLKYDPFGYRVVKEVTDGTATREFYIRDAYGNPIAIYYHDASTGFEQRELQIYGAERLGTMGSRTSFGQGGQTVKLKKGEKQFELLDHLGNIMASLSDKLLPILNGTGDAIIATEYDLLTYQDYYPFGMMMPGRKQNPGEQRYGFNSQEMDSEIYGSPGTSYTAEFWQYDSRLGRRWNLDPLMHQFPSLSAYSTFSGNPIAISDINGDCPNGDCDDDDIIAAYNSAAEVLDEFGNNTISQDFYGIETTPNKENAEGAKAALKAAAIKHTGITPVEFPVPNGLYDETFQERLAEYNKWIHTDDAKTYNAYYGLLESIYSDAVTLDFAQKSTAGEFDKLITGTSDKGLKAQIILARNTHATDYRVRMGLVNYAVDGLVDMGLMVFTSGIKLPSKSTRFAFWSGKGTEAAAIKNGYRVIGNTRAGKNLMKLIETAGISREVQLVMWKRMSATLARSVPRNSTAHVFVTKESINSVRSVWNTVEKPILQSRGVKIITHIVP